MNVSTQRAGDELTLVGVDPARVPIVRSAVAGTAPQIGRIVRVEMAEIDAVHSETGALMVPAGPYARIVVAANTDPIAVERALWQADLVLAHLYVEAAEAGIPIRGGVAVVDGEVEFTDRHDFSPVPGDTMYDVGSGVVTRPRHDLRAATRELERRARERGFTVDSLSFANVRSLAPVLDVTAENPGAATGEDPYAGLFDDLGDWDGVYFIIRGPDGHPVGVASYATGIQAGSGWGVTMSSSAHA